MGDPSDIGRLSTPTTPPGRPTRLAPSADAHPSVARHRSERGDERSPRALSGTAQRRRAGRRPRDLAADRRHRRTGCTKSAASMPCPTVCRHGVRISSASSASPDRLAGRRASRSRSARTGRCAAGRQRSAAVDRSPGRTAGHRRDHAENPGRAPLVGSGAVEHKSKSSAGADSCPARPTGRSV